MAYADLDRLANQINACAGTPANMFDAPVVAHAGLIMSQPRNPGHYFFESANGGYCLRQITHAHGERNVMALGYLPHGQTLLLGRAFLEGLREALRAAEQANTDTDAPETIDTLARAWGVANFA